MHTRASISLSTAHLENADRQGAEQGSATSGRQLEQTWLVEQARPGAQYCPLTGNRFRVGKAGQRDAAAQDHQHAANASQTGQGDNLTRLVQAQARMLQDLQAPFQLSVPLVLVCLEFTFQSKEACCKLLGRWSTAEHSMRM